MQEGFGGILRGKMAGRHKACPYREQGKKSGRGFWGRDIAARQCPSPKNLKIVTFYPLQMQCCA